MWTQCLNKGNCGSIFQHWCKAIESQQNNGIFPSLVYQIHRKGNILCNILSPALGISSIAILLLLLLRNNFIQFCIFRLSEKQCLTLQPYTYFRGYTDTYMVSFWRQHPFFPTQCFFLILFYLFKQIMDYGFPKPIITDKIYISISSCWKSWREAT